MHGAYERAQTLLSAPERFGALEPFVEPLALLGVKLEAREFALEQKLKELRKAKRQLAKENTALKAELQSAQAVLPLSESPALRPVMRVVERVAPTDATVLIGGESGSGKEVLARTVHALSARHQGPFTAVNCAALPESLLEAELFGVEAGAATGVQERVGKIEAANGGTLFLDEIGDMALGTQARMLRAIEEREVVRVGANTPRKVDFRLVAATHVDLPDAITQGQFREDLYYRLCVVVLELPPLRVRRDDILPLARVMLASFGGKYGRELRGFEPEAERRLLAYDWPGNIRELRNAVERATLMADDDLIRVADLVFPTSALNKQGSVRGAEASEAAIDQQRLKASPEQEKQVILDALAQYQGNRKKVAEELGVHRETLRLKMKRYGIIWKVKRGRKPASDTD